MTVPDKIYLAFEDGFVAQSSTIKEDANGNNIFLSEYIPIEYIRKEALLEWFNDNIKSLNVLFGEIFVARIEDKLKSL